jgi:hypothetical protein
MPGSRKRRLCFKAPPSHRIVVGVLSTFAGAIPATHWVRQAHRWADRDSSCLRRRTTAAGVEYRTSASCTTHYAIVPLLRHHRKQESRTGNPEADIPRQATQTNGTGCDPRRGTLAHVSDRRSYPDEGYLEIAAAAMTAPRGPTRLAPPSGSYGEVVPRTPFP